MFSRDTIDDAFVIETERLCLRWPRLADAAMIEQLAGDRAVAEMTALIPHPYPAGAAEPFVFAARLANADGSALTLAIAPRRKPKDVLGVIGIHREERSDPFIGLWLGVAHWGKGLATEAVRAMVDTVFEDTEARSVTAGVRVVNPASRRVLEKCGFRHEGSGLVPFPARGGVFPVDHMRLDRRTWASLKGWRDPLFVGLAARERAAEGRSRTRSQ
jgi:RimJ/RimL family protein N-acetyltransferase